MAVKRIVLFPYHPDIAFLIEHLSGLKEVLIIGVYSYKEDTVVTDPLNKKLGCTGDFDKMLAACDQVILLENYRHCKTDKYYEVIEKTISMGRQVILMPQLEKELDMEQYKGNYEVFQNIPNLDVPELERLNLYKGKKYKIEIPVIAVFGMGKHCNKFENQFLIKNVLDEEGYDVVWISSNSLGALAEGYTMPDFLYDAELSFERKVFAFNEFMYRFACVRKPDIFIIGVPEGISEFEVHEYHHFAEYPLVIGSAVPVDSAVLCTYFLQAPDIQGIKAIISHSREKFGFPVDMVSIGKSAFETIQGKEEMTYSFLSKNYVEKYFASAENLPDSIAGVWDKEKMETAIKSMLERLRSNVDTV